MNNKFSRPNAKIHFGGTGKPGVHTKQVKRDEIGDMQITVTLNKDIGRVQILFDRPCDMLALPPDKAYDLAHLILEQVKDKQGGEPVNVTEEKVIGALEFALETNGILGTGQGDARHFAAIMAPSFFQHMASEEVVVSEIGHDAIDERPAGADNDD